MAGFWLGAYGTADDGPIELSAFPVFAGSLPPESGPGATQLAERMAREARVDLQTRGGTRYQTDISIRGGIFEGTGLLVGGLALFDPQTGHYAAEVPLDPVFFAGARLLTGINNSIYGFNATAGSIDWQWAPIVPGGGLEGVLGSDALRGGRVWAGGQGAAGISWQVAALAERGDGSVANGDFRMERISGRLELALGAGRLRLFGGHVEKFYGWPGMYTGRASLNETEDYRVSLLGWQWEGDAAGGRHRVGGYWRQLDDDYEFNRAAPNRFFEHLTEVWSVQGDGHWPLEAVDLRYRWAWVKDRIRRSTSLVHGRFDERDYGEAALLAQRRFSTRWGELAPYAGVGLQSSSRDATVAAPQVGARLSGPLAEGAWEAYAELSETSKVPGYTVLNSAPSGLFGGNPDLGRERARTFEGGFSVQRGRWSGKLAVFQREETDLVDWVFAAASPSARQAAALDLRVRGLEGWLRWEREGTAVELGYALLDKDPAYKAVAADASFYVLNHARQRLLATIDQAVGAALWLRLEGEYREHPANLLRAGGDSALFLNIEANWRPHPLHRWELLLRLDNLTDKAFESLPGTPGARREGRLTARYRW
jgi:vitamin B12 transporter